jgi:TonB family protein
VQPQWPAEARRYEIEGATTVRFEIGADGAVLRPAITRSSGWQILDDAALHSIAQCRFQPDLPAARDGTVFPLQYVWKFDDAPAARPCWCRAAAVRRRNLPLSTKPIRAPAARTASCCASW